MANAATCWIMPRYIGTLGLMLNQTGSMKLNERNVFFYTVKVTVSWGPHKQKPKISQL